MQQINLKQNIELNNIMFLNFICISNAEKEMIRNWRNNENVRKRMYTEHIISAEEHQRFWEGLKKDENNYYWLVKSKDGEYLGVFSLNRVDLNHKNAYFGIYSNPETKINAVKRLLLLRMIIKLSFEIVKLHTLKLEIIEGNREVIAVYKMIGFHEEGRLKEFASKDGKWKDVVIMGMINPKC